jgi:hypothetical protein
VSNIDQKNKISEYWGAGGIADPPSARDTPEYVQKIEVKYSVRLSNEYIDVLIENNILFFFHLYSVIREKYCFRLELQIHALND